MTHMPRCGVKRKKITQKRRAFCVVSFFFWLCQSEAMTPAVLWIPCCVSHSMGSASIHWTADLAEINDQKDTFCDFVSRQALLIGVVSAWKLGFFFSWLTWAERRTYRKCLQINFQNRNMASMDTLCIQHAYYNTIAFKHMPWVVEEAYCKRISARWWDLSWDDDTV